MNIETAIAQLRQSRTKYQIEKFVIGQHNTPEMQFRQLVLEIDSLKGSVRRNELKIEKKLAEIDELKESGKKSDLVQAKIIELEIEDMRTSLQSQHNELNMLKDLFDKSEKFTMEEIEANQPAYWQDRLTRVAQMQMLSRQGGVDWAQLDALYQANIIEDAIAQIPTMDKIKNRNDILLIETGDQDD